MLTYIVHVSLVCSLCVAQFSEISQPVSFQTAKLGDAATIECYIKTSLSKAAWYKLTTGGRLQLVARMNLRFNWTTTPIEFHQHYSVRSGCHLSITATEWEDVGIYFCGVTALNNMEFGSGTFLMLKGPDTIGTSVVQQPAYTSVHPGGSVTLSCSAHTRHCTTEHISFMWFKISDGSDPEIVDSSETKSNGCREMEDKTTSCVNRLHSDAAGTYYCVVTSCGFMRFGNGTRIKNETSATSWNPAFIALIVSNILLGLVIVSLIWARCMSWRRNSAGADGACEANQASDSVIYATAVHLSPRGLNHTHDAVQLSEDIVYSKIRDFQ